MKKLFVTITLLVALIGSAFAENFVNFGWFENDGVGKHCVIVDIDAREPYNAEEESIEHLLYLQSKFDNVVFDLLVIPKDYCETRFSIELSKEHKIYRTVIATENCAIEYCVCYDGTVIRYMYTFRD